MTPSSRFLFALAAFAIGCSSSGEATSSTSSSSASDSSSSASTGAGGAGGMPVDPTAVCDEEMLAKRPFDAGPYGTHRGDTADDFTLDLLSGESWNFKERFSGCESYVFVPDTLPVSDLDPSSVWDADKDLKALVKASPKNAQYFFVSRAKNDADAATATTAMQARVDALLATLPADDAAHWKARLHVAAKRAASLGNWVGDVLGGHGAIGFSIDRRQTIRGAGYLADVTRFDQALNDAGKWPWKSNLAYAAHDPQYFNADAVVRDRLDAESATVVKLWDGETLQEYADTTVTLPSAAEMAGFDTLEVEITQACPDPDKIEIGNCGAWDYIASLSIEDAAMTTQTEIARFITSYHRETHWVVDVSEMLPLLAAGGSQAFRWSFAPSWNTQPTATKLSLRFSNQNKGMRPTMAIPLFSGGDFGSMYNVGRAPVDAPIPADAKKVELWTLTTGHGSGTNQCSEFCDHQHEFTVDGAVHLQDFPGAGTNAGCIAEIANGMTPNQAGTWWFGRGGWCPGEEVKPWVVDVSSEITPGQTATVSYHGLYGGNDPPDGSGNIVLTSYLVVFE